MDISNKKRVELVELTRQYMEEWTRGERTDFWLGDDSENKALWPIVDYIDKQLDIAANMILAALPLHMLQEVKKEIPLDNFALMNGIGYIPQPKDFLKLEGIRLSSWTRNVFETCKVGTDEYLHQQNKYVRGISDKPKIGLAYGKLELYSIRPDDCVCYAYYIPRVKAEEVDEKLFPFVALQCAIKVEEIFGDTNKIQTLGADLQAMLATTEV